MNVSVLAYCFVGQPYKHKLLAANFWGALTASRWKSCLPSPPQDWINAMPE